MTDADPAPVAEGVAAVLVLNAGSSSLKHAVLELDGSGGSRRLATGIVERIGDEDGAVGRHDGPAGGREEQLATADHADALRWVVAALDADGLTDGLAAIGHRVVHGGDRFSGPALVDDDVLDEIARFNPLAPLHNPANLLGVRVARQLRPDLPQVAVFDTAFHATIPPAAHTYAIPRDLAAAHGIRRYGFHGTSHAYVSRVAATHLRSAGRPHARLITLHLGNGASMAAVRDGACVDTTMGMSPLEGLVMGTRSGDLDPTIVFHLVRATGRSPDEVEHLLNRESGLKGLCGDNDVREVTARSDGGDEAARLALEVYVHRIRRYVGAFVAVLGGADALVFTAGVGENAAGVRAAVCADLDDLGVAVDAERNRQVRELREEARHGVVDVAATGSAVRVLVVPTDEELEIARQALSALA